MTAVFGAKVQPSLGTGLPGRLNTRMDARQQQGDDLTEDAVPQTPTGNHQGGAHAKDQSCTRMPSTLHNTEHTPADSGFSDVTRSNQEASAPKTRGEAPDDVGHLRLAELDIPMEKNYPEKQFDFVLFYIERDKEKARAFFKSLMNYLGPLGITGCLYDDIFAFEAEAVSAVFALTEELISRSTYMLFYITETFKEDFTHEFLDQNRIAANEFSMNRDHCLTLSLRDPKKKWCLVPVFTKPKYKFEKLPFGLLGLAGLTIDDSNDYLDRAKKLFSTEKAKKLKQERKMVKFKELELWKIKMEHYRNRGKQTEREKQGTQGVNLASHDYYCQDLGVHLRGGASGDSRDLQLHSADSVTEVKQRLHLRKEPMPQGRWDERATSSQARQVDGSLNLETEPKYEARSQQQKLVTQPQSAAVRPDHSTELVNAFFTDQRVGGPNSSEMAELEYQASKEGNDEGGASFDSGMGSTMGSTQPSHVVNASCSMNNSTQSSASAKQGEKFQMNCFDLEEDGPVDELNSSGSGSPVLNSPTRSTAFSETEPKQYFTEGDCASLEVDEGNEGDYEEEETSVMVTIPSDQCDSSEERTDTTYSPTQGGTIIYNKFYVHIYDSSQIQVGSQANMSLPPQSRAGQTDQLCEVIGRQDNDSFTDKMKSAGPNIGMTGSVGEGVSGGLTESSDNRDGLESLLQSMAVQDGADGIDDTHRDVPASQTFVKETAMESSSVQTHVQEWNPTSDEGQGGSSSDLGDISSPLVATPSQSENVCGSAATACTAELLTDYRQSGRSPEGTPV